jgi:hypothetical protein
MSQIEREINQSRLVCDLILVADFWLLGLDITYCGKYMGNRLDSGGAGLPPL